jgi:hypothetical protein
MLASELFDGRLKKFGCREHRQGTDRCVTDGRGNYLFVCIDDAGYAVEFTTRTDPHLILTAITEAFDTQIFSEDEPRFWGFPTWEAKKSPRGTKSRSRRRVTAIPDNLGRASDDRITKEGVAERSIRKTIATLISPLRPRTKLGRQTQHRGELIRKLAEAERAYRQFQFDTAMANSSDRPTRMTADEYRDAVLEFEELEYDLAAAINEFVYYEVEKWDEIGSRQTMARIEAAWDSRDAYWEAHPDELTQQQRMDFFRRGVGDARKAGVLVK